MHRWDTFRVALHLDGVCNAILFFGCTSKLLAHSNADFLSQRFVARILKYTKYSFNPCFSICDKISRPETDNPFLSTSVMEVFP